MSTVNEQIGMLDDTATRSLRCNKHIVKLLSDCRSHNNDEDSNERAEKSTDKSGQKRFSMKTRYNAFL